MQEQKPPPPRAEAALLFISALIAGAIVFLLIFFQIASEPERARGVLIKPIPEQFWPAVTLGILITLYGLLWDGWLLQSVVG